MQRVFSAYVADVNCRPILKENERKPFGLPTDERTDRPSDRPTLAK